VSTQGDPAIVCIGVARVGDVLQRAPSGCGGWLSPSERERYASIGSDARRRQYLAGHWLLRERLAAMRAGAPTDWSLVERPRQAPSIPADASLSASLSHSGDWVAAACATTAIGIDIEARGAGRQLGRFEHLLLAEDDSVGTLDDDALLQRWVVKEAQIKRHGGSALPRQLAALRLRRDGPAADVRLYANAGLYLGIAVDAGATVQLDVDPPACPHSTWHIDGDVIAPGD